MVGRYNSNPEGRIQPPGNSSSSQETRDRRELKVMGREWSSNPANPSGINHARQESSDSTGRRSPELRVELSPGPGRLLIADDNEDNTEFILQALRPDGYDIKVVRDGKQALQALSIEPFDLLLLDLMMPVVDGFEVLRRLRETGQIKDLPVIVVTARNVLDTLLRSFELGAVDYLTKPFHPAIIRVRTRSHLQAKRGRDDLRKLTRIREEFLSIASHDLKVPVSTIFGFCELMLTKESNPLQDPYRDYIQRISGLTDYMLDLIHDLLEIVQIETGRMELHFETVDSGELIRESVETCGYSSRAKSIELSHEIDRDLPMIIADRLKIRQVLQNLISNAIKFCPADARIRVSSNAHTRGLEIRVSDNGPGIPEAELGRLFETFSSTSVRPTGGERSTGLGLAIARRIVDLHGGQVWVESEVGKGSTFGFILPLQPDTHDPVSP